MRSGTIGATSVNANYNQLNFFSLTHTLTHARARARVRIHTCCYITTDFPKGLTQSLLY